MLLVHFADCDLDVRLYDCGVMEFDGLRALGFRLCWILEFGIGRAGLLHISLRSLRVNFDAISSSIIFR